VRLEIAAELSVLSTGFGKFGMILMSLSLTPSTPL
jgi:hypothetical protein